jgi:hypothetical protein
MEKAIVPWRGMLMFTPYSPCKLVKHGRNLQTVHKASTGFINYFIIVLHALAQY